MSETPSSAATRSNAASSRADAAAASWAAWWDAQDVAKILDDASWRRDAEEFVEAAASLLRLGPDDDVLDVGCGPAFALEAIARRGVRSAVGVDVSPRLLDAARARLARATTDAAERRTPTMELLPLDRNRPTDLSVLGARRFTVVICNSVMQYLKDVAEAEALLSSMLDVCAPGARVLVSDLVVGGGRFADAWGLLRGAWRRGRLREAWRRLRAMRRSSYAATRARLGLVAIDPERLAAVARSHGATAKILSTPLTMLANRQHLLLTAMAAN